MSRRSRWGVPVALGLAASLLALGLLAAGAFRRLEELAVDGMLVLRGPRPPDPRVVICAIDAASVDRLGQWPWPRTTIAALVDRLAAAGARVIAFDVVFAEPSRADAAVDLSGEDAALAAALERAGGAVLGYYFRRQEVRREGTAAGGAPAGATAGVSELYGGDPGNIEGSAIEQVLGEPPEGFAVPRREAVEPNIDLLAAAAASQGFFSTEGRRGGVARYYELVVAHRGRYYPALALRAAALFTGGGLRLEPGAGRLPRLLLAGEPVEHGEGAVLWLDHRGPAGTFPTYSAADLLAGAAPPEAFTDRLVFVGATEPGIGDLHATPFGGDLPGVEVHATAADTLLGGRALQDGSTQGAVSLIALLLLGPAVAALVAVARRHALGAGMAIGALLLWPAAAYGAFRLAGWHLQVVAPAAAGLFALVAALTYRIGFADRRARQIREAFSRYVSPGVVEEMLAHPERVRLGGERRAMTVLFADIRGFTTLAEGVGPEVVARLLNRFFTPMTRRVLAEGGTLDKYMGDALMAFFGAPLAQGDHATRACRAALGMGEELERLNRVLAEEGALPAGSALGIGIGLSTGEMVVGNMGSEEVFDYTVIGDTVNLGSRIEGLNRIYGTRILVSEAAARAAGDGFLLREIDRVRVKGKQQAVTLYELVAAGTGDPRQRQRVVRFEAGLAAYRGRDFYRAERMFSAVVEDLGDDGPARLYAARCRRFLERPPPEGWDGVVTLSQK